jgi:hypothetical protein
MFSSHYNKCFDELSKLEEGINSLIQLREFLAFTIDKYNSGENIESNLESVLGFLDYATERIDSQFPEVWSAVITEHPDRFSSEDA